MASVAPITSSAGFACRAAAASARMRRTGRRTRARLLLKQWGPKRREVDARVQAVEELQKGDGRAASRLRASIDVASRLCTVGCPIQILAEFSLFVAEGVHTFVKWRDF